ncbi:MAG: T9SS type A sorting domain-containing protein [Bacteroidia bacterium]|nr:T9SS type A sorting domain-containing protein [Bacteroidia bacterium]
MKYRWIKIWLLGSLMAGSTLLGQNNPIFNGGDSQGYDQARISQNNNNLIFAGGEEDGFARMRFAQASNNRIFAGGLGQGYVSHYYLQASNNQIFSGGEDDGVASLRLAMNSNNSIFTGGSGQGYIWEGFTQSSNNSIFGGGNEDGYSHVRIEGLPAALNPIFPIELLSFDAWAEGDYVQIEWQTASEVNHDYFQIERSQDLVLAESIGLVPGKGGPQEISSYELKDPEPLFGSSFYRLQSVDKNGEFEFSAWVEVYFERTENMLVSLFPNPTRYQLNISISQMQEGKYEWAVFDLMGRPMGIKKKFEAIDGEFRSSLSLGELPSAIYVLRLLDIASGKSYAFRIKVMR